MSAQILVLAKAPVAGRVKTRLCPPLSPQAAADVADAALQDTLDAVRRTPAARPLLVLDGAYDAPGFTVLPQRGDGLDERLAAAFEDAWSAAPLPTLLVGMDTPQLRPALLTAALAALLRPGTDAVLGRATDGGWWGLGLRRPDAALLLGVPTSRADTGRLQRDRLVSAGLRVADLPVLRDVDTVADLAPVRRLAPGSLFAVAVSAALG